MIRIEVMFRKGKMVTKRAKTGEMVEQMEYKLVKGIISIFPQTVFSESFDEGFTDIITHTGTIVTIKYLYEDLKNFILNEVLRDDNV